MPKYYIGIDGGGTKCRLLAVDQERRPIGEALGKSTNLSSNTKEFVLDSLTQLFEDFFELSGMVQEDCSGICIGSAGLDSQKNQDQMEDIIKQLGFTCKVTAVNDSLLALAAATRGKPGVVVVSGTGSIAYGMDAKGKTVRCGGWGHILDDEGSGYWMGKEALRCAMRAYDGRGQNTMLVKLILKKCKANSLLDCMDQVYRGFDKSQIAGYSKLVEDGAQQGDAVSLKITAQAAQALYELAAATLKQMQAENLDVIVSGGNILNNAFLYTRFHALMEKQYPNIQVKKIDQEPVIGAIYLATPHLKYSE